MAPAGQSGGDAWAAPEERAIDLHLVEGSVEVRCSHVAVSEQCCGSQASPLRSTRSPVPFLSFGASTELGDDFDLANDGIVERSKVFSRNPVLQMIFSPCLSDLIAIQKLLGDEETRKVSLAAGRHIPITGDLRRMGFTQHWIKDRLSPQSRRKGPHP